MKATLVARSTADGLVEVNDDVPIGRVYEVMPGSETEVTMVHKPTGKVHTKVMVQDVEGGWLPVEMLRLERPA